MQLSSIYHLVTIGKVVVLAGFNQTSPVARLKIALTGVEETNLRLGLDVSFSLRLVAAETVRAERIIVC